MIAMFNKPIKIYGLLYEDELKKLTRYIDIVDCECMGKRIIDGVEIKVYEISIYKRDKALLRRIMCDSFSNDFCVRER